MTATATRATATVTRAGVQHAVGQIIELSAQTLAAGQARIDRHASGHISRQAEVQSLRVIHAAQSDLVQAACERWIELLYDGAPSSWWNVREDGIIRLAPPWSRSRRGAYGLSEPQARLLLRITRDLLKQLPERRQLYWYVPAMQRYALNRSRFPSLASALDWQRTVGAVNAAMWHGYAAMHPGGR